MNGHIAHHRFYLGLILLYGLAISLLNLNYNSVFIDEAYHITMGREILRESRVPAVRSRPAPCTSIRRSPPSAT